METNAYLKTTGNNNPTNGKLLGILGLTLTCIKHAYSAQNLSWKTKWAPNQKTTEYYLSYNWLRRQSCLKNLISFRNLCTFWKQTVSMYSVFFRNYSSRCCYFGPFGPRVRAHMGPVWTPSILIFYLSVTMVVLRATADTIETSND